MKRIKWVLSLIMAALLLSITLPVTAQDKSLRIAFSIPGFNFPFFRIMETGAKAVAEEIGNVELISLDGQDDDAIQLSSAEDAIAAGIDGMVISPRTTEGLASLFDTLAEANIPVITVDRRSDAGSVLAHVGADNVAGGTAAGQFIADKLGGKGNVIELLGTPGASPAIDRSKGFNDAIAEHPDINVVAQQTGNFSSADALTVTEDILTTLNSSPENPGFDALFAANDDMVMGAIEAIRARGLDPSKFVIVGFDALQVALDAINEGSLTATIDQYPNEQAGTALKQLVEFIRNGTQPEAATFLTPVVISKDNVDQASTLLAQ